MYERWVGEELSRMFRTCNLSRWIFLFPPSVLLFPFFVIASRSFERGPFKYVKTQKSNAPF